MSNGVTVQAPGKLLLCGEYAVLHGAPALCAAVNRYARCNATPSDALRITALGEGPLTARVSPSDVTWMPAPQQPAQWKLVEQVLLSHVNAKLDVTLDTAALSEAPGDGGAPVKLGLGSSAAAAVALVAALDLAQHGTSPTTKSRRTWFETAQRAHLAAQGGLGSGVDVAASSMGGVFSYVRPSANPTDARIEAVHYEKLGVRLLAVWTGTTASTTKLLGQVEAWREQETAKAQQRFTEMMTVAQQAANAASNADRRAFLMAIDAYGGQMQLLGDAAGADIVSAPHRKIRELARQHECVAKPSGAGGGDVAVCFAASGWEADDLRKTLKGAGFVVLNLSFDHEGVRTVV